MGSNETPAEMFVRHVLEGEKHIADQTALIERLRLMGLPTEDAQDLLEYFCQLQAQHEKHLRRISDECELGLRDKQGGSPPTPGATSSDEASTLIAVTSGQFRSRYISLSM